MPSVPEDDLVAVAIRPTNLDRLHDAARVGDLALQ